MDTEPTKPRADLQHFRSWQSWVSFKPEQECVFSRMLQEKQMARPQDEVAWERRRPGGKDGPGLE